MGRVPFPVRWQDVLTRDANSQGAHLARRQAPARPTVTNLSRRGRSVAVVSARPSNSSGHTFPFVSAAVPVSLMVSGPMTKEA